MYKTGTGVEENKKKAFRYLKKAVGSNCLDSYNAYGKINILLFIYKFKKFFLLITLYYSAEMLIEKGKTKEAKSVLVVAAKHCDVDACYNLGTNFIFISTLFCFSLI